MDLDLENKLTQDQDKGVKLAIRIPNVLQIIFNFYLGDPKSILISVNVQYSTRT